MFTRDRVVAAATDSRCRNSCSANCRPPGTTRTSWHHNPRMHRAGRLQGPPSNCLLPPGVGQRPKPSRSQRSGGEDRPHESPVTSFEHHPNDDAPRAGRARGQSRTLTTSSHICSTADVVTSGEQQYMAGYNTGRTSALTTGSVDAGRSPRTPAPASATTRSRTPSAPAHPAWSRSSPTSTTRTRPFVS